MRLLSPRRMLVIFLGMLLLLGGTFGWLGWRLVEQESALEERRLQERLENAADLLAATLLRHFSRVEEQLDSLISAAESGQQNVRFEEELGGNALFLSFDPGSIRTYPENRLLYYPSSAIPSAVPGRPFLTAEQLEFQTKDLAAAGRLLQKLAASQPQLQAGALIRLGRIYQKQRRWEEALEVYQQLRDMKSTRVGRLPASLLGQYALCDLLQKLDREKDLRREVGLLLRDLLDGRWKLDRPSFLYYFGKAQDWLSSMDTSESGENWGLSLAEAAETMWQEWQRIRQGETKPQGHRLFVHENRHVLLVWKSRGDYLAAFVAGSDYLADRWLREYEERQGIQVSLSTVTGDPILTGFKRGGPEVQRTAGDTGLPWTIHVAGDRGGVLENVESRKRLIFAGLAVVLTVIVAGTYFIGRAVSREMEVIRLKSDFVAAVSHEFRTPLTSLRQFTELLASGRVSDEGRRNRYYEILVRETARLHRLVDNLLDFGRLEAGALQYRKQPIDAVAVARSVVNEFQQEVREQGYFVDSKLPDRPAMVEADPEALGRVLWNLLDNAVKYSPDCKTVWVDLESENGHLVIKARDRGIGIPASDQERIFERFARGGSSSLTSVKGTGLGLAMVQKIVRDHGGNIQVKSAEGAGSTFTVVLPLMES